MKILAIATTQTVIATIQTVIAAIHTVIAGIQTVIAGLTRNLLKVSMLAIRDPEASSG